MDFDGYLFLLRSRSPLDRDRKKVSEEKEDLFWKALITANPSSPKRSNPDSKTADSSRQDLSGSAQFENLLKSGENSSQVERITRLPDQDPSDSQVDALWKVLAKQANLDLESGSTKKKDPKPAPTSYPNISTEVLRPGNYQLVVWDALTWVDSETQVTHICRIEASIPQGEEFQ